MRPFRIRDKSCGDGAVQLTLSGGGTKKKVPLTGKPKTLPVLIPNKLRRHGYSLEKSALARHRALIKASTYGKKLSKKKMLSTRRRLIVLGNYTSESQPANARKYRADEKWLKKKYDKM